LINKLILLWIVDSGVKNENILSGHVKKKLTDLSKLVQVMCLGNVETVIVWL